ncbi:hypothetical protein OY671_010713, partial [Metschnikowia pulcherrima]
MLSLHSGAFMQSRHSFSPPDNTRSAHLCGPSDEHSRTIEAAFGVTMTRRGEQFRIEGARGVPQQVAELSDSSYARSATPISAESVQRAITSSSAAQQRARHPQAAAEGEPATSPDEEADGPTSHTRRADSHGRTPNQVQYSRHISSHDSGFGIGPAGTGK